MRRRVALKVIKAGMDTKQVIARFEGERQALAMMDHPNIAKVFDAGATEPGRPYFVMEVVQGEPITDYCDRHKLTIEERLELFVPICQAIQHAHLKGIIHRDVLSGPERRLLFRDRCCHQMLAAVEEHGVGRDRVGPAVSQRRVAEVPGRASLEVHHREAARAAHHGPAVPD